MKLREEFWDTAPHYGGRKGNCYLFFELALILIFEWCFHFLVFTYQRIKGFVEKGLGRRKK